MLTSPSLELPENFLFSTVGGHYSECQYSVDFELQSVGEFRRIRRIKF